MTELETKLTELIDLLRRPTVAPDEELWNTEQVALYLDVAFRTVRDKYAWSTSFPAPVQFPSETGLRPEIRWLAIEVKQWAINLPRRAA